MADLSDVLTALAQGLAAALYPNGTAQPSVVGADCFVFPGWPDTQSLDADLAAGKVQVSVFPRPGMARVQGRTLEGWRPTPRPVLTMAATYSGETCGFAGLGSPNQIAAVVEGNARAWTTPATGTAEAVATALAALIAADRPVTRNGTALTLPGAINLRARVVIGGGESIMLRRQAQGIQVTIWAPTPALRSAVGAALDEWVALTPWLALPADESARLIYAGLNDNDDGRQAKLHRRDLMLSADYPTTARREFPGVAVIETDTIADSLPGSPVLATRLT